VGAGLEVDVAIARRLVKRSPRQGILGYLYTVGPATPGKLARELSIPIQTVLVLLRDEEHFGTVERGWDARWCFL